MKVVNRIKASKDFASTIKKGKAHRNESFVVHIASNNLNYTRIGISVSAKLGNAVTRNRVKRQIRAMCDSVINYNENSYDIVIVAKGGFLEKDFADNKNSLCELLQIQVGIN